MRPTTQYLLPVLASSALAQSATSTMSSGSSSSPTMASNKTCLQQTLCITATVGATDTTYLLDYIGSIPPGWVGIGFGQKMAGSPMVIMWANADGTITLSQRQAGGHVMPTPVAAPARVAKLDAARSNGLADQPTFAFTIPNAEGAALTRQQLIWAASLQAPSSAAADATIQFHDAGFGSTVLDVSTPAGAGTGSIAPSQTASATDVATGTSAVATASSSAAVPASSGTAAATGSTGGRTCVGDPQVMCISAVVNATTTVYELTAVTTKSLGWLGLGFGKAMAGSPMVVLYKDSAGGVVLSQRTAPGNVMPTPVTNPPRVATLNSAASDAQSAQPTFTFAVPTSGDASAQQLIWAAASTSPESASPNATIRFHDLGYGAVVLDASGALTPSGAPADSTASKQLPLNRWQKFVVVHAVLFAVGFLVMLPIGALVARLLRTSVSGSRWFRAHAVIQGWLTFPIMVIAFAFATSAVEQRGAEHYNDFHKKLGLALFILYLLQVLFGSIIHFIKPRSASPSSKRPLQNYFHAIVGLAIIGLAYAQVRSGYAHEWDRATRRGKVGDAVNVLWIVWVVALPLLYFGGLALLPRQFRQEREAREAMGEGKKETSSQES